MFRFFIWCAFLVFLYYNALHAFMNLSISKRGFSFLNSLEKLRATSLRVSILSMAETTWAIITKCFFVIVWSFYMVISGSELCAPLEIILSRIIFGVNPTETESRPRLARFMLHLHTPTWSVYFFYIGSPVGEPITDHRACQGGILLYGFTYWI